MFLNRLKKIYKILFLSCLIIAFNFCDHPQTQPSETGGRAPTVIDPTDLLLDPPVFTEPAKVDTVEAVNAVTGKVDTEKIDTCHKDNYRREFIFDSERLTSLINVTGVGCQLQDVVFENINLEQADLRDANFQNAQFINVKLKGANLTNATLKQAILIGIDFRGVKSLKNTNFQGAHLQNADFRDIDLENTDFQGAHLQGADFRDVDVEDLEDANFLLAEYNNSTHFPEDFNKEEAGMILVEDNQPEGGNPTADQINTPTTDADIKKVDTCHKDNYRREFIFDSERLTSLINVTGAGCQLQDVVFENINLEQADLRDANFQNAQFINVKLKGANLTNATLKQAILIGIDFRGVKSLKNTNFQGAHLQNANFIDVDLENTDFQGAHLQGADFRDADFESTKLQGAHLQGADFRDADFESTKLQGAHLQGADFRDVDVEDLEDANFLLAEYNNSTHFPEDFNKEEAGMILVEDDLPAEDDPAAIEDEPAAIEDKPAAIEDDPAAIEDKPAA